MTKWNAGQSNKPFGKKSKTAILTAAVAVAEREGFGRMTRAAIADQAQCGDSTVSYFFSTMTQLRRDVMRHAVQNAVLKIVAEGLATGNTHAAKALPELKRRALATLAA